MARLHILIGYESKDKDAAPNVIHAGRDGDEAIRQRDQALRPGGWCRVEHFIGPQGHVKHNADPAATRPQDPAEQDAAEPAAADKAAAEKPAAESAAGKAKN